MNDGAFHRVPEGVLATPRWSARSGLRNGSSGGSGEGEATIGANTNTRWLAKVLWDIVWDARLRSQFSARVRGASDSECRPRHRLRPGRGFPFVVLGGLQHERSPDPKVAKSAPHHARDQVALVQFFLFDMLGRRNTDRSPSCLLQQPASIFYTKSAEFANYFFAPLRKGPAGHRRGFQIASHSNSGPGVGITTLFTSRHWRVGTGAASTACEPPRTLPVRATKPIFREGLRQGISMSCTFADLRRLRRTSSATRKRRTPGKGQASRLFDLNGAPKCWDDDSWTFGMTKVYDHSEAARLRDAATLDCTAATSPRTGPCTCPRDGPRQQSANRVFSWRRRF
jgi:hypothetical protein